MHDTSTSPAQDSVTVDEILRAHFTLTNIDGAIECIDLDGAEGWTSPNPHPALSLMRFKTVDQDTAAAALDTVLDRFGAEGRGLEWMAGPECYAAGFDTLLTARGFDPKPMQIAAMSMTLGDTPPANDKEQVDAFRVEGQDRDQMGRIMARGFSVPDEVGEIYHQAYLTPTNLQTTDVYAARVDGGDDIVGAGYLTYLGDSKNALLRASSVLETNRGKGAYKALVQQRLTDAAQQGCAEIFVHAYSKGSRECLTNLGFRTLGGMTLHSWSPKT